MHGLRTGEPKISIRKLGCQLTGHLVISKLEIAHGTNCMIHVSHALCIMAQPMAVLGTCEFRLRGASMLRYPARLRIGRPNSKIILAPDRSCLLFSGI